MRIPRYWKKGEFKGVGPLGKPITYVAWGWSDESLEQAAEKGSERAYTAFRNHNRPKTSQQYEYLDIPLREAIEDILYYKDKETARITRNRYGALVLNAAQVLFVDIDLHRPRVEGAMNWFRFQLSSAYRERLLKESENLILNSIIEWSLKQPNRSFRFYRTKAGFRILFTDQLYHPESDEVATIFEEFNSDPLYQKLTKRQQCFRARLTPKPWRIGMKKPNTAPSDLEGSRFDSFASWVEKYDEKRADFSVCSLIRIFGAENLHIPEVEQVLRYHDEYCCRGDLPLG